MKISQYTVFEPVISYYISSEKYVPRYICMEINMHSDACYNAAMYVFTATQILVVNFVAKNLPSYLNDSSLRYVSQIKYYFAMCMHVMEIHIRT